MNFRIFILVLLKKTHGFDRNCIKSLDCFECIDILTKLFLPVQELRMSFHFFVSFSVSFFSVL